MRSEYLLRRPDGSWAWVIDVGQPRFSDDGAFLGYVGSLLDITERRAAELAQQESQAFIRSIFDSSPDCIRVLDLEGRPLLMNKAGRRIFGLAKGRRSQKPQDQLAAVNAEGFHEVQGYIFSRPLPPSEVSKLIDRPRNRRCTRCLPTFGVRASDLAVVFSPTRLQACVAQSWYYRALIMQ